MTARHRAAAQMSTYPMDVRHVEYILPHQIRTWSPMVDRFVVTIDTHQSRSGRYRVSNFESNLERLREILHKASKTYPQLQVVDVDYSDAARRAVAQYFLGTDSIPIKAWDGGPFYSYFYGLYVANCHYVMHFDGDMLFGGGSRTWLQEAIACMERQPEVLVTAPFPGPPRADRRIFGHQTVSSTVIDRSTGAESAYRHQDVSTRAFMIDLERFKVRVGTFPSLPPGFRQRLKALLLGNPRDAREAEVLLSKTMQRFGLCRIDLLGAAPGMWSLHPPYRSEEFYRRLPEIIAAVEAGNVPEGQRGDYDLNDSMIDWTQARAANVWHRRYGRMIRQRLGSFA